ncbi:DUF4351 domain-containing protein [Chloroflexi bacterium TSY]|nr:DUF4351 domain-containing protein [Chloroflexi bacterium TSY]MBV7331979.1 DUF4351 domain-containing protein [Chloroflexi bacterium TSY]MBV7334193.1 DUF4351 domain-containing protein [Chloroflexi bacterium TSY]
MIETYLPAETLYPAKEEIMLALTEAELSWQEQISLKAKYEFILDLLNAKFNMIPEDFLERIQAITDDDLLDKIAVQLLSITSLAELGLPEADAEN